MLSDYIDNIKAYYTWCWNNYPYRCKIMFGNVYENEAIIIFCYHKNNPIKRPLEDIIEEATK